MDIHTHIYTLIFAFIFIYIKSLALSGCIRMLLLSLQEWNPAKSSCGYGIGGFLKCSSLDSNPVPVCQTSSDSSWVFGPDVSSVDRIWGAGLNAMWAVLYQWWDLTLPGEAVGRTVPPPRMVRLSCGLTTMQRPHLYLQIWVCWCDHLCTVGSVFCCELCDRMWSQSTPHSYWPYQAE